MKDKGQRGRPKKQFDITLMTNQQLDELEVRIAQQKKQQSRGETKGIDNHGCDG